MKDITELLREADPLQDEPIVSFEQRALQRRTVLAAADSNRRSRPEARPRVAILAAAVAIIVAGLAGVRVWSPNITAVQAAVRFEARLAEDRPVGPDLREAKISGSNQSVFLHDEIVVGNSDISAARLVPGSGASSYAVSVAFNADGAKKMQAATMSHVGKLIAILLDGQVVMAPAIRSPLGGSAIITGSFSKAEAERIVNGITIR